MKSQHISIIDCIIESSEGLSLSQVMKQVGYPKTTTYRCLEGLVKSKLLSKLQNQYFLGSVMLRWMHARQSKQKFIQLLRPHLSRISQKTKQTVHLVQLQGNMGVYIDKIEGDSFFLLKSQIGNELELYSTGAGKAILSLFSEEELDTYFSQRSIIPITVHTTTDIQALRKEIAVFKRQGYSLEVEQNEKDIQCVGVSFRWASMTIAISITATLLTDIAQLRKMGEYLLKEKKRIIEEFKI